MDCFGTYFTHVQTCTVTRVQSATQWTASLHMSKHVQTCNVTRVKVLRNGMLRYILYTCPISIVVNLTTCTRGAHKIHSCKNKGVHTAKPFRVYRRGPWPRVQMRPLTACTDEAVTLATLARTIRVYLRPWPRTIRVYLRPQKARAQPTPWPENLASSETPIFQKLDWKKTGLEIHDLVEIHNLACLKSVTMARDLWKPDLFLGLRIVKIKGWSILLVFPLNMCVLYKLYMYIYIY